MEEVEKAATFLHILAFQCPQSRDPIVESVLTAMRNSEQIDGASFNLKCQCGWSGCWLGAQARKRIVISWYESREGLSTFDNGNG